MRSRLTAVLILLGIVLLLAPAQLLTPARAAQGQGIQAAGRPISKVKIEGLGNNPTKLVQNQIRSEVGEPYNPSTVEKDIVRLTHLGRFSKVTASVQSLTDGSVVLSFHLTKQPLISQIQISGNENISTDTLLKRIGLVPGDPASSFLIDRGKERIEKKKGSGVICVLGLTAV